MPPLDAVELAIEWSVTFANDTLLTEINLEYPIIKLCTALDVIRKINAHHNGPFKITREAPIQWQARQKNL